MYWMFEIYLKKIYSLSIRCIFNLFNIFDLFEEFSLINLNLFLIYIYRIEDNQLNGYYRGVEGMAVCPCHWITASKSHNSCRVRLFSFRSFSYSIVQKQKKMILLILKIIISFPSFSLKSSL